MLTLKRAACALSLGLPLLLPHHARAQTYYQVVTACNNAGYVTGRLAYGQQTTGGLLCTNSTGGGGTTTSQNQIYVGSAFQNWGGVLEGGVNVGLIDWGPNSQAHADSIASIAAGNNTIGAAFIVDAGGTNRGTINAAGVPAANTGTTLNVDSPPGGALVSAINGSIPAGSNTIGAAIVQAQAASARNFPGCTVAATTGTCLAASTATQFLQIQNASATATVACAFGVSAVLNSASSVQLAAGQAASWGPNTAGVPTGALNCIASGASTPLYLEWK